MEASKESEESEESVVGDKGRLKENEAALAWSFEFDDESAEKARIDLRRALIVQNDRAAVRLDPAAGLRTPQFEGRLQRAGFLVCVVGALAALVLLFMGTGVSPGYLVLLFVFLLGAFFFRALPSFKDTMMGRVDTSLEEKAKQIVQGARAGGRRFYETKGSVVSRLTGESPNATLNDVRDFAYALVGETCVVLFAAADGIAPKSVLLVDKEQLPKVHAWLVRHNVECEELEASLLRGRRRW